MLCFLIWRDHKRRRSKNEMWKGKLSLEIMKSNYVASLEPHTSGKNNLFRKSNTRDNELRHENGCVKSSSQLRGEHCTMNFQLTKIKILIPVKIIDLRSYLKVFTGIKKKKCTQKFFSTCEKISCLDFQFLSYW